jgi:hypothetical protein
MSKARPEIWAGGEARGGSIPAGLRPTSNEAASPKIGPSQRQVFMRWLLIPTKRPRKLVLKINRKRDCERGGADDFSFQLLSISVFSRVTLVEILGDDEDGIAAAMEDFSL